MEEEVVLQVPVDEEEDRV
jgi:hypothetical protein